MSVAKIQNVAVRRLVLVAVFPVLFPLSVLCGMLAEGIRASEMALRASRNAWRGTSK